MHNNNRSAAATAFVPAVALARASSASSSSSFVTSCRPTRFTFTTSSTSLRPTTRIFSPLRKSMTATTTPTTTNNTPTSTSPATVTVVSAPGSQKTPAGTFDAAVALGAAKASSGALKILLLAILGGAYIALGGFLALRVGGAVPGLLASNPGLQRLLFGLIGLPSGLLLVLATGAELFTGNTMLLSTAVFSGAASLGGLLRNWIFSFIGNFLGSLLVVKLVVLTGWLPSVAPAAAAMAVTKAVATPFAALFYRGVVCNWLVCLAVYIANGATDLSGKFIAAVVPVSMFLAMGMEHSVANMFLIPLGMKAGADVSVKALLLGNLLPVTLGNIVAGVVLVALTYFLAFAKKTQ